MECPSSEISDYSIDSLDESYCSGSGRKQIFLKLHPDKNPGCKEESNRKFLRYTRHCEQPRWTHREEPRTGRKDEWREAYEKRRQQQEREEEQRREREKNERAQRAYEEQKGQRRDKDVEKQQEMESDLLRSMYQSDVSDFLRYLVQFQTVLKPTSLMVRAINSGNVQLVKILLADERFDQVDVTKAFQEAYDYYVIYGRYNVTPKALERISDVFRGFHTHRRVDWRKLVNIPPIQTVINEKVDAYRATLRPTLMSSENPEVWRAAFAKSLRTLCADIGENRRDAIPTIELLDLVRILRGHGIITEAEKKMINNSPSKITVCAFLINKL